MTDLHSDELTTNPTAKTVLIAVGIVLIALGLTFGAGYWQGQRKAATNATQSEAAANVAKGEADAAKRQAISKDAEIAAKDHGLAEARADVARKMAQLEALRAPHASVSASAPRGASFLVDEPVSTGVVDLAPLVRKQDDVIQSQAYLIQGLEVKISDLVISRNAWKQSAEDREREAAGLWIALEAQKSLTKGALWKGRFQGLAVGFGSGYLLGRSQK